VIAATKHVDTDEARLWYALALSTGKVTATAIDGHRDPKVVADWLAITAEVCPSLPLRNQPESVL
jgi:hypothetical protein